MGSVCIPADMQWRNPQDLAAESYMMPPLVPAPGYNPYWNGMQPGMDGYMGTYGGGVPYMGYGFGPLDMPFGGVMPQDPFAAQGYMMPPMVPPQRYAPICILEHYNISVYKMGCSLESLYVAGSVELNKNYELQLQAKQQIPFALSVGI